MLCIVLYVLFDEVNCGKQDGKYGMKHGHVLKIKVTGLYKTLVLLLAEAFLGLGLCNTKKKSHTLSKVHNS